MGVIANYLDKGLSPELFTRDRLRYAEELNQRGKGRVDSLRVLRDSIRAEMDKRLGPAAKIMCVPTRPRPHRSTGAAGLGEVCADMALEAISPRRPRALLLLLLLRSAHCVATGGAVTSQTSSTWQRAGRRGRARRLPGERGGATMSDPNACGESGAAVVRKSGAHGWGRCRARAGG